jgi:hypothetical protein
MSYIVRTPHYAIKSKLWDRPINYAADSFDSHWGSGCRRQGGSGLDSQDSKLSPTLRGLLADVKDSSHFSDLMIA